jgi:hypothetical protein
MIQDFLWRQFLWFCFRNGLWYGESGNSEIISSFADDHEQMKIVNSYDLLQERRKQSHEDNDDDGMKNIIVISTLERTLRLVK